MTATFSPDHLPFSFDSYACSDYDETGQGYVPLPSPWQKQVRTELRTLPAEQGAAWCALWLHCAGSKGKTPAPAWLKKARILAEPVMADFSSTLARWLDMIVTQGQLFATPWWQNNQPLIRALLWLASLGEAELLAMPVARLMHYGHIWRLDLDGKFRKAELVSEGGFWTLSGFGSAGVMATLWLKTQSVLEFTYGILQPFSADQLDLLYEELPFASPFDAQGQWVIRFGNDATLTYQRDNLYRPQFVDAKGKSITKEPRKLWKQYALTRSAVDTRLGAMRNQLSELFATMERATLSQRCWQGSRWLALFDDPQRLGYDLARERIWCVQDGETLRQIRWLNGQWCDVDGKAADSPAVASTLWLWHPAMEPDDTLAERWRQCLIDHRVTEGQQAWRVVYRLPPAEAGQTAAQHLAGYRLLERFYWQKLNNEDPDSPYSKTLAAGWSVRLHVSARHFSNLQFRLGEEVMTLGQVPPVIYSEGLRMAALTVEESSAEDATPMLFRQLLMGSLRYVLQQSSFADRVRLTRDRLYVRGDYHEYSLSLLSALDSWPTVRIETDGRTLTGFEPGVWGDEDKLFGIMRRNLDLQAMYWPLIHEWSDRIFAKVRLLVHEDEIEWEWVRKQILPTTSAPV
ncbi:MAG: DUF4132 domain-containing protein [Fluviicoccus sp.]|uniref:DUF4132 domain-containing protein n=1 Tax=Fluviicoccus sp. TaxID=2003552 RepID=UPI00271B4DF6|nr:DUF4132 domain-containing protein [Fluviicoccus sp.]MDO8332147.1 DUF4132 domain-containing protein [Fluviicoccus sp.]